MKTNEAAYRDADQQQSHSPDISLYLEGASERNREGRKEVRVPMSRHQSSHNATDTNPGSVPLAPDGHKSYNGSQQEQ